MRFFEYSRLDIYMAEIQSDLSRVETLIANSADLLFAGFANINLMVRVQQKLGVELASARESGPHAADGIDQAAADKNLALALAQQAVVADQVELEFSKIVRALQFQDLTTQLLAHAKGRLAALESTLERISDGAVMAAPWHDDEALAAGHGKTRFRPAAVRTGAPDHPFSPQQAGGAAARHGHRGRRTILERLTKSFPLSPACGGEGRVRGGVNAILSGVLGAAGIGRSLLSFKKSSIVWA